MTPLLVLLLSLATVTASEASSDSSPSPPSEGDGGFQTWQIVVIAVSGSITLLLLLYLIVLCRQWSMQDTSASDPKQVVVEMPPPAPVIKEDAKEKFARQYGGVQPKPKAAEPPKKADGLATKAVEATKKVVAVPVEEPRRWWTRCSQRRP